MTKQELELKLQSLSDEIDQLRVQLAGCSVAALGSTKATDIAVPGQFGWSVSYQDVLNLRRKYEKTVHCPLCSIVGNVG